MVRLALAALCVCLATALVLGQVPGRIGTPPPSAIKPLPPGTYLGSQACAPCHRAKFNTFVRTGHHLATSAPSAATMLGQFSGQGATMATSNPGLRFHMDARTDGFYETALTGTPQRPVSRSERMAIVIGSGRQGQGFLYWRGNALFQLPVSLWSGPGQPVRWINAPGYADGVADFDRAVTARCLECHTTYFQLTRSPNVYDKTNFMLGIGCERCHGPGGDHVDRHNLAPLDPQAQDTIVNTATLSRDRQMELCAVCHLGHISPGRAPSFSYVPGEPFDLYFHTGSPGGQKPINMPVLPAMAPAMNNGGDVQGDQVGLLRRSRCYQASTMTCSTCHDVHAPQRDPVAMSDKCLKCHKVSSCRVAPRPATGLTGKCVECHMPRQTTQRVTIAGPGATLQVQLRTHLIKVYPAASGR